MVESSDEPVPRLTFWLLVAFSACAQYDSGALGAFEAVMEGFGLSVEARGAVKAAEYVWLPIACLAMAPIFTRLVSKNVLVVCCLGNLSAIMLLCLAPHVDSGFAQAAVLFASRSIAGIFHSGIAVFGCVWVDRHAPQDRAASWMGMMQASSLFGLMIGFGAAGVTSDWVATFLGNAVWFAVICLGLLAIPAPTLNVRAVLAAPVGDLGEVQQESSLQMSFVDGTAGHARPRSRSDPAAETVSQIQHMALRATPALSMSSSFASPDGEAASGRGAARSPLLGAPDAGDAAGGQPRDEPVEEPSPPSRSIYFLMGLAVSSLFFVSSGLQFWVTPYMEQLYLASSTDPITKELRDTAHQYVILLVILISLTAPTMGVIAGGLVVDSCGGYSTARARQRALLILIGAALLVIISGYTACFATHFWVATVGFWVMDALGAALLPGSMGIMLAASKPEDRAWASAGSQIMINILGMAGGAFLPALFTGCDTEATVGAGSECDYTKGLRSILGAPVVGLIALALAALVATYAPRHAPRRRDEGEVQLGAVHSSTSVVSRTTTRMNEVQSSQLLRIGVVNQIDKSAGTMVLDASPDQAFQAILAKAAQCIGMPVRRLFLTTGEELKSMRDILDYADLDVSRAPSRETSGKISLNLELISTDGLDFKWKWGDTAKYKFGSLLLVPLSRALRGQKAGRAVIHPPQPMALPLSGNLKDCLPDLWQNCFPLAEKYGPLIKLRIFDDVVYICADPETVDIINQVPDKRIPRTVFGIKTVACDGVFIADGQRWEFARNTLQGSLTPEGINGFIPSYIDKIDKLLVELEKHDAFKGPIDVFEWVERMTMDVICDVGFGHDMKALQFPEGQQDPLVPLFDEVLEISINASLYGAMDVFGSTKRQFERQCGELNKMLDDIITQVREGRNSGSSNSLIGTLMKAKCPLTSRGFDQSELRDQLVTFLVAGHKTTTLLLTWALYNIAGHPEVEQKMIDEMRQVFEDQDRHPTADDLRKLRYTDMVIREVLRLASPVQVAQRGLTQPVQAGKYTLLPGGHSGRGNSWVAIHIMGISRSKKYWGEDHMEFKPERFEPDNVKTFHPFQYIPFGGGRRLCIGNLFAITQVKTALTIIMRKYHLRAIADKPAKIDPKDLATPLHAKDGGGVWLRLIKRTGWDQARPPSVQTPSFVHMTSEAVQRSQTAKQEGPRFDANNRSMLILWGGEFGTTKTAAEATARLAGSMNFNVTLKVPDDLKITELKDYGLVVGLIATYNGNPTTNATQFVADLQEAVKDPDAKPLDGVDFAILGMGNSNWISTYVKIGRVVDSNFEALGGKRLVPFEIADKNDAFEDQLDSWQRALFSSLGAQECLSFARASDHFEAPAPYLTYAGEQARAAAPELLAKAQGNRTPFFKAMGYSLCQVVKSDKLVHNPPLTDKYRDVRQIRIKLPDGASYLCGDHCEIVPRAPDDVIDRLCRRLQLHRDAVVQGSSSRRKEEQDARWRSALGMDALVGDVLGYSVDVLAVPSQLALAGLADLATNPAEASAIRRLTSRADKAAYEAWAMNRPSFVDALEAWPSVKLTLARLAELAPKTEPRLYSIASSPSTVKDAVDLCVGIVKYETESGAVRSGLCSTMLATAQEVYCKVRSAPHMRLPSDATIPLACVCGGTGIAPFLGFLEEREFMKKSGATVEPITLYFGCRAEYDCLHGERLRAWEAQGLCRLSFSFSRKQGLPREYVYDALRRDSRYMKQLLSRDGNGLFMLCGSASGLGKDCTSVLAEVLGEGDLATGLAEISELQGRGRIVFDVWG